MLHLGMGFVKFLEPVNNWFLYIEPSVAQDVKKIILIYGQSLAIKLVVTLNYNLTQYLFIGGEF